MTHLTKPKKPLNAYSLFLKLSTKKYRITGEWKFSSEEEIHQALSDYENQICTWKNHPRTRDGSSSFREMIREANTEWKQLSAGSRRHFTQSANRAREAYEESLREWRLSQDRVESSRSLISYSTVSPPSMGETDGLFSVKGFNLVDIHSTLLPELSFSETPRFPRPISLASLPQLQEDYLVSCFGTVQLEETTTNPTAINADSGLIDPSELDNLFKG